MRVLVTDGEQRSALAVVRSLGRRRVEVEVCTARLPSLAGASRWCAREHQVPDPTENPAAYVEAVSALATRRGLRVVVPVTDASMDPLLAAGSGDFMVPAGPLAGYRQLSHKDQVLKAAGTVGLRVPSSRLLPDRTATALPLAFPVVLKPTRSLIEQGGRLTKLGVTHVATAAGLGPALARIPREAFPVLAQERIVGPGVGVFILRWGGRRLATFCHERIREKPPAGGVSVYARSVAAEGALIDRADALLASVGWNGVAMVELKRDGKAGDAVLMEVNARFWGSLQLAIDSGVDFPYLLLQAATGQPMVPLQGDHVGTRGQWWFGDLDHLLLRWRRSAEELALLNPPGRLAATFAFLRASMDPRVRNEVCRWSDLRPAWRETLDWIARR